LIESTQIRRFSMVIKAEEAGVAKTKSLKTSSRDHQPRDHSDQMVLMMVRREADP
jgi:hypothetical protein